MPMVAEQDCSYCVDGQQRDRVSSLVIDDCHKVDCIKLQRHALRRNVWYLLDIGYCVEK